MHDKQLRYRARLKDEGKCPHCGKPCFPYRECEDRRFYKKLNYTLNRMVKAGICDIDTQKRFSMTGSGRKLNTYKTGSKGDRRNLPRILHKPDDEITIHSLNSEKSRDRYAEAIARKYCISIEWAKQLINDIRTDIKAEESPVSRAAIIPPSSAGRGKPAP